jgi:hypothetical protein
MDSGTLQWLKINIEEWLTSPRKKVFGTRAQDFMISDVDQDDKIVKIQFQESNSVLYLHFWMFERTIEHLGNLQNLYKPLSAKVAPPYMEYSVEGAIWKQPFPKAGIEYRVSPVICDILHHAGIIEYGDARNPGTGRRVQGAILKTAKDS